MFSSKSKRVMTSFDLAVIIQELNEVLSGSRIDNIYQVSPLTLLIVFRPRQRLVIEAGKRVHLTEYEIEKPQFPSIFCRILRKHLNQGVVQEVCMDGFERVMSIEIVSKNTSYKLVCEIFGKGNIILTDNRNTILRALSYRRMRDRTILRGDPLQSPPSRGHNPLTITPQEIENLQEQPGEVVRALARRLAIGGLYAEEVLQRAKVEKNKLAVNLTKREINKIYGEVRNLVSKLTCKDPHIVINSEDRWIDVLPFPLQKYSENKMERYRIYNRAADEYFTKLALEGGSDAYKELTQSLDEQKRILSQQEKQLETLVHDAQENRRIGDTIYLHAFRLQGLLTQILEEKKEGAPWSTIISDLSKQREEEHRIVVDSINPTQRSVVIKIDDLHFELDLRKSIFDNAASFYEQAKRLEAKRDGVTKAIVKTKDRIERGKRDQHQIIRDEETPTRIRKRLWFEKFHWAQSSEGFLMIGGRDATTNELLIKKHTDANDLVFHADIPGASFVVLKTEGKTSSEQTIFETAQLAASYSRGWRAGWASTDVYWVRPEQISKGAPSGEYLTKGMFMVRGQKNYIRHVPLRVAIGVVEKEGKLEVIGGSVSAIEAHARYQIQIVPGRRSSGETAKLIRSKLASSATKEFQERILKLKIEEIQRFIPPGKSEIAIR